MKFKKVDNRYTLIPIERVMKILKEVKKISKTQLMVLSRIQQYALEKILKELEKQKKIVIIKTILDGGECNKKIYTDIIYKKG